MMPVKWLNVDLAIHVGVIDTFFGIVQLTYVICNLSTARVDDFIEAQKEMIATIGAQRGKGNSQIEQCNCSQQHVGITELEH